METKPEATMPSASDGSEHSDPGIRTSNLPDEMWYKIFSYLLLNDRKSIRLTCHHFYDVTNCRNVQKTEEIVFNGSLNTDAAILSFANSKRKVWNIKLNQTYLLDSSILVFFENQGTCVRSLIFDDCRMVPGLLKNIIEYCENLNHLVLSFRSNYRNQDEIRTGVSFLSWDDLEVIFSDFKALHNDGIIRQNVTNFSLNLGKRMNGLPTITNEKFCHFFAVFPNIKELELVFSDILYFSNNSFSYSCLRSQLLKMCHQLERLKLFHRCDNFSNLCPLQMLDVTPRVEIEKLKELSLNCTCLADTSAVSTIPQFRFLTNFKFCLAYNVRIASSLSAFVELILNTATELCHLTLDLTKLGGNDSFNVDMSCFQALVRSQLKTLRISLGYHEINFPTLTVKDRLSPNFFLKYFFFDTARGNLNYNMCLFTTYFHRLEILIVHKFSANILQNIFKYQANLRYLEIYNLPRFENVQVSLNHLQLWLINTNLPSRRLDHLTHLLLAESKSLDLSEFLLEEFTFPKLQSLVIMLSLFNQPGTYSINDTLWRSIQNLSELEYLEIRGEINISFSQWVALCRSLFKLRYFLIFNRDFKQLNDLEYRRLFQIRPSLSIIFHGHDRANLLSVKYFKDSTTNMVRNIPWPRNIICTHQFIYEGIPQKYYKHCYNVRCSIYRVLPDLFYT